MSIDLTPKLAEDVISRAEHAIAERAHEVIERAHELTRKEATSDDTNGGPPRSSQVAETLGGILDKAKGVIEQTLGLNEALEVNPPPGVTPCLPQDDPNPEARQTTLSNIRRHYQYKHDLLGSFAMANQIPVSETPSEEWIALVKARVKEAIENALAADVDESRRAAAEKQHASLIRTLKAFTPNNTASLIKDALALITEGIPHGRPISIGDYDAAFATIDTPNIATCYHLDETFVAQRVAGYDVMVLEGIDRLPDRLPFDDQRFRAAIKDPLDSLDAAGAEGRLYLADYQMLSDLAWGNRPDGPKYGYAPIALFALPRGSGRRALRAVAIQCDQDPSSFPVFTPQDGAAWSQAKYIVQVASANLHELVFHFARTHAIMEAASMSARRNLSPLHPVMVLLGPHLEGTLTINNVSAGNLLIENGPVDQLLSYQLKDSLKLGWRGFEEFDFDQAAPPRDFERRRVLNPDLEYPYRDDATDLWLAIDEWVSSYLALYYPSDEAVNQDWELRRWIFEMASPQFGRVPGLGDDSRITTRSALRRTVSTLIFTASVQHAAVNFPQWTDMSYPPNVAPAAYRAAPASRKAATLSGPLDFIPAFDMARLQVAFMYILGRTHYTQLGHYRPGWFSDRRVAPLQAAFVKRLDEIDVLITKRNLERTLPYNTLRPSAIPQSINI